jgi:CPA1 family monovalent cation:H+ antiporter
VVLGAFLIAAMLKVVLGRSVETALVFGALIAATDPISVLAIFSRLGAPQRLATIVEGESLFNDGTAIVVFNVMLAAALPAALSGGAQGGSSAWVGGIVDFARVSAGGIAVGVGLGWLTAVLIARLDDHLIETTLTTILAFGAYILAERMHFSGVLAVVSAGIINGNIGPKGMSPTTRIVLFNFWEYLAFIANSLVFLLIGLDVNIQQIVANPKAIGVAVLAVVVSRALTVYGITGLTNLGREKVPWAYQHVLFWGGLRGAVSLALVLSLPAALGGRELLRVMAFGVVLFTLLAQGTTMQLLMRRLGLVRRAEAQLEYERRSGRLMASRAARQRLLELYNAGVISLATWERLSADLDRRIQKELDAQRETVQAHPELQAEEIEHARREGLRAERAVLATLQGEGVISERVYVELLEEVDAALEEGRRAGNGPKTE